MLFETYKNALVYNLIEMPEQLVRLDQLQEDLSKRRHTPIISSASSSRGFTHPLFAQDNEDLFVRMDQFIHLAYISEEKDIDVATINARVDEAVAKAEADGREVNQELKTSLSEQFERELMPYFKVSRKVIRAYIDMKRKVLVVNASNTNTAEDFTRYLRTALGSFKVTLMRVAYKPCRSLSHAIKEQKQPENLCFYEDGKLVAKNKPGKDIEKQNATIEGFDAEDENVRSMLDGLDVVYADLFTRLTIKDGSETVLGFGLNSKSDTERKRHPDVILTKLNLGMSKRYFNDEVNAAVFENCTYIGVIIDRLVQAFGGCEETDYLNGEFEVQSADLEKIETIKAEQAEKELDEPLFEDIKAYVLESRRASVSGVQRQFKIGYNRAARAVEMLESHGVVSAPGHDGVRTVLKTEEAA
ncbi:recombination-associated protein RdgC [Vibrio parahaemolyticus]